MSYSLDTSQNTEIIHVDSQNLTTNSTTGYSEIEFFLNSVIDLSQNTDVFMSLDTFEIALPYNITSSYNTQYFEYNSSGISASNCQITMTPGNYIIQNASDENNLCSELQHTLLTEIQKNGSVGTEFNDMNITYSDLTGKMTINSSSTQGCTINASTASHNTLLPFLGFRTDDVISASSTLTSNYPINMCNPRMIYVMIDIPISPQLDSRVQFKQKQILQKIPNTTIGGSVLTYVDSGRVSNRHLIKSNFISKIKIWLEDENSNRIDLQGLYFSMAIKFEKLQQQQNQGRILKSMAHDFFNNNDTFQKHNFSSIV